jgi:transglutaminase-like putative cysteine protease
MQYYILHNLNYSYSKPIFLEIQIIRLRPRSDSFQQLHDFELAITPKPESICEHIDQECNNAATLWFNNKHTNLAISAKSEVEVLEKNPFDFIITENTLLNLPAIYPEFYRKNLQPYLIGRGKSPRIVDFIQPLIKETRGETIPFLLKLTSQINKQFDWIVRDTGAPMAPEKTLIKGKGACRDLAMLFIKCVRTVGLAARFVSGYRWGKDSGAKYNMHAWAEVFLPGGGWRGFDPSNGLAVTNQYVAVASAAEPANAAPINGTFRGTGTRSKLEYNISIHLSKDIPNTSIQR